MKINSTPRTFTALYDFAVSGGTVGTINLGSFFKPNTKFQNWNVFVLTGCTSGGSATVSFGLTGLTSVILLGATAIASLTTNDNITKTTAVINIPSTGSELTMSIAVADLTAGKILFTANVVEVEI